MSRTLLTPAAPTSTAPSGRPNIFELLDNLAEFGRRLAESEQADAAPPTRPPHPIRPGRESDRHAPANK